MAIDRSEITINGRRTILVERRPIRARGIVEEATPSSDGPANHRELATLCADLARDARRIPPSGGQKPERFHEAKSDLAAALERLSRWARRQSF